MTLIIRYICYARPSVHPKLPDCISELHDSLYIYGIVGSSTILHLEVLRKIQNIYIDGAFKYNKICYASFYNSWTS